MIPRAAGALGQSTQVAAWVRQPVRMVNAEAVELAFLHQVQQELMCRVEDLLYLLTDGSEGVDVGSAAQAPPRLRRATARNLIRAGVPERVAMTLTRYKALLN